MSQLPRRFTRVWSPQALWGVKERVGTSAIFNRGYVLLSSLTATRKMRSDQYACNCVGLNFQLHRGSHSKTENSDVSQIQLDSSYISWLTVITSLTCCISTIVSPPCEPSSFPAYHGSALVKTMPSSLLPLVCICFSHPWHLLLLRLGFPVSHSDSSDNAYTLLAFVAFATTLHFQILATCQATSWLVVF